MNDIPLKVEENTVAIDLSSEQARVIEAVSPTVALERISDGVVMTVKDVDGERSETVYDGPKGDQGERGETGPAGAPGISPTISVTDIAGGHRVTITDATGEHSFDVMDGEGGGTVQDVRVNGVSVLQDGVANVPLMGANQYGVAMAEQYHGIMLSSDGYLTLRAPTELAIKLGNNTRYAVNTLVQHLATFYGLAKAAGDTTQSQSSNPVGTYTPEAKAAIQTMLDVPSKADIPEVPVQDVQVNGVSVLQDGVATIPIGNEKKLGLLKVRGGSYGIASTNDGTFWVNKAASNEIKSGDGDYKPITTNIQHLATFYGLAKAAGSDEKNSTLPIGQYTEAAKSAIHEMLNGSAAVSGTTPTIDAKPGVRYVCGEVSTITITVPASGIIDVVFTSGSTPAVLTINGTVRWANGFDPENLDANTVYELNIADGLGVAGTWT